MLARLGDLLYICISIHSKKKNMELTEMLGKAVCLEVTLFKFKEAYEKYTKGEISKEELDGVFQKMMGQVGNKQPQTSPLKELEEINS
jgi:hypothetical protein